MDPVQLHVPDSVPKDFLNRAVQNGLVSFSRNAPSVRFEKNHPCACSATDHLLVRDRSIWVTKGHHSVVGYPVYGLPETCTLDESVAIVVWLLRFRFKTFRTHIANGTLERTLSPSVPFAETDRGCCDRFEFRSTPVFMLRDIVLSPRAAGPTLESALKESSS